MAGGIKRARVTDIITLAAKLSFTDVRVITGRDRSRPVVRIRQAVCKVAREHGHSLPFIGRMLGRDHTTIMHACNVVDAVYPRDAAFAKFIDELRRQADETGPFVLPYEGPVKVVSDVPDRKPAEPNSKTDFRAIVDAADNGHRFHANVAKGSKALARALRTETRGL